MLRSLDYQDAGNIDLSQAPPVKRGRRIAQASAACLRTFAATVLTGAARLAALRFAGRHAPELASALLARLAWHDRIDVDIEWILALMLNVPVALTVLLWCGTEYQLKQQ